MSQHASPEESLRSERPLGAEPVIRAQGLSKAYKLYAKPLDRLKESIHPLRRKYHRQFYALRDVNFEVRRGETVGIVGRNGSGKSTLLKLIAGVLTPSAGSVEVRGGVAAILELGAGFNPELSGVDNVYFSGALLGFSRREMDERLDAILGFADIGDYAQQPVKTYSSGMLVRLAFSVQTMVDASILIVDEALAVGDEAFQRKCFSRLERLRRNGVTLLYVSHQASSVIALCNHALFLHKGELILEGRPKFVVSSYQRVAHAAGDMADELVGELVELRESVKRAEALAPLRPDLAATPETAQEDALASGFDPNLVSKSVSCYEPDGACIENVRVEDEQGKRVNLLERGRVYYYCYDASFTHDCEDVAFAMLIKTTSGFPLGGARSHPQFKRLPSTPAGSRYAVRFEFACNLNPGVYFGNAGIEGARSGEEGRHLHRILDAVLFRVLEETNLLSTMFVDFRVTPHIVRQF